MTARRPPIRRFLKWMGIAACVLIVVAWGVSIRWSVSRVEAEVLVMLVDGHVFVTGGNDQALAWSAGSGVAVTPWNSRYNRYGFCWPSIWLRPPPLSSGIGLPLWFPLLVIAIPTAILWHRDRRRYPHRA